MQNVKRNRDTRRFGRAQFRRELLGCEQNQQRVCEITGAEQANGDQEFAETRGQHSQPFAE